MNRILDADLKALASALVIDLTAVFNADNAQEQMIALWQCFGLALPKGAAWNKPDHIQHHALYIERKTQITELLKLGKGDTGIYQHILPALLNNALYHACLRSYESVNEAQAEKAWLYNLAYQHDYTRFRDGLTLLRQMLEQLEQSLPHVIQHKPQALTAALLLAYEHYEDIERVTDIVQRNDLRHSGFILPETELEMLSR